MREGPAMAMDPKRNGDALVEMINLQKFFPVREGLFRLQSTYVRAVEDVSLTIREGETLGLVGESGCGKTTLGRVVVRLIEPTGGKVLFRGENLLDLKGVDLRRRRRDLQMVFQDPAASLNPRKTILQSVGEPLRIHGLAKGRAVESEVLGQLERVGLKREHLHRYPHEFSGGQRQRISIARALTMQPRFLVLDEPTSALDVSVQAQILNLLRDLQQELGLTYLFISHNLAVVAHMSDRVAVMYLGRVAETAPRKELFEAPLHPYTKSLLTAVPVPNPDRRSEAPLLEGEVASPLNPPPGCRFHPRCPLRVGECETEAPPFAAHRPGHEAACFRAGEG